MQVQRWVFSILSLSILFFLVSAFIVHAQVFDESALQLLTDPEFPGPRQTLTVSLDAYTMNTTGATIQWYVDGVERGEFKNERSMTLVTGELGTSQIIKAKVSRINSFPITTTLTIEPREVNIILEAATYVPSFYKGRALPSGNSLVRAVAIPSNASAPLDTYTYEWSQSGTVLFGGPVKGKYAADITMSRYEGDYLKVTVTNASGRTVGGKAIFLTPTDPELHFYEENPLRGLSTRAAGASVTLIGDETTIHGEPYFMSTDLSQQSALFDWGIDGMSVTTNPADQHTLTLRRTGGAGSAQINVHAITTEVIPQYVQGGFSIVF